MTDDLIIEKLPLLSSHFFGPLSLKIVFSRRIFFFIHTHTGHRNTSHALGSETLS